MTLKTTEKISAILESTIYCNIATICKDGSPWNTPVFFGYDDQFNLYWRSWTENMHSQNLLANPTAFITVYDSGALWGEGEGIYLQGEVVRLEELRDIKAALQIIDRRSPREFDAEEFMAPNPRRLYKFTPAHIWHNVDSDVNGLFVDTREEMEWRHEN